jgi:hypothetical protein
LPYPPFGAFLDEVGYYITSNGVQGGHPRQPTTRDRLAVLGSDAGTGAEADGDGEIKRQKSLSTFRDRHR